jgi:hypothetical protein
LKNNYLFFYLNREQQLKVTDNIIENMEKELGSKKEETE